jgi:hypothetical protein
LPWGGTGANRTSDLAFINANYITRWGGAFGSLCLPDGTLTTQDSWALYWSQTEHSATNALGLNLGTSGAIYPQSWILKDDGFTLRCIR